jgi:hypothetical protein
MRKRQGGREKSLPFFSEKVCECKLGIEKRWTG